MRDRPILFYGNTGDESARAFELVVEVCGNEADYHSFDDTYPARVTEPSVSWNNLTYREMFNIQHFIEHWRCHKVAEYVSHHLMISIDKIKVKVEKCVGNSEWKLEDEQIIIIVHPCCFPDGFWRWKEIILSQLMQVIGAPFNAPDHIDKILDRISANE